MVLYHDDVNSSSVTIRWRCSTLLFSLLAQEHTNLHPPSRPHINVHNIWHGEWSVGEKVQHMSKRPGCALEKVYAKSTPIGQRRGVGKSGKGKGAYWGWRNA